MAISRFYIHLFIKKNFIVNTYITHRPSVPPPHIDQDMKRGYAFVFLKDPPNQAEKERCEKYVQDINGMYVPLP